MLPAKGLLVAPHRCRTAVPRAVYRQLRALSSTAALLDRRVDGSTSEVQGVPNGAKVVIGGGGIVGCAVAYYLAKAGWKDVILLEKST